MRSQQGRHTRLDSAAPTLHPVSSEEEGNGAPSQGLCPSGGSNLEAVSQRIFQKLGPRMGIGFTAPQVTCTSNPVVTLEGEHAVRFVAVNS